MLDSENLNKFNERRNEFKPYGMTCELWTPSVMRKPDRHNEVEINYFPEGEMTYLVQDKKITIPARRFAIFWGLVPHQIVQYEGNAPYFVCTIPFSQFLEWKLPALFVDRVLKGEVLIDASEKSSIHDEYLLNNWINDISKSSSVELILLEMHARLYRMAVSNIPAETKEHLSIHTHEISQVEQIAIYIAQNYCNPIKVSDIGKAVGLHPDYANAIFKKAFGCTLTEYIIDERIAHAQRKLVATTESITAVAFECGFNSMSRFNAAFLKVNGCTPREFRKRFQ